VNRYETNCLPPIKDLLIAHTAESSNAGWIALQCAILPIYVSTELSSSSATNDDLQMEQTDGLYHSGMSKHPRSNDVQASPDSSLVALASDDITNWVSDPMVDAILVCIMPIAPVYIVTGAKEALLIE